MTLEPGAAVTTTYAERAMGMAGHLDTDDFKVAIASDLLADIPRSFLETILPRCLLVELDEGQTLIERGLCNEYLFLLLSGSLRVQLDDGQLPHHLVLGPGECVGEVSVIDGRGASGSVISIGKSRLLKIDRETLWYLVGATEAAARNLLLVFSGRMRRDNDLMLASLRQRREFERMATVDGTDGTAQSALARRRVPAPVGALRAGESPGFAPLRRCRPLQAFQ
ncbi:MAG: cyclic nucleotide-binding domain-containing protein [Chromatiales bacterium]|nr:cyclic nucleotide-binding domain-containing protein [Chromatiales bacterium]